MCNELNEEKIAAYEKVIENSWIGAVCDYLDVVVEKVQWN